MTTLATVVSSVLFGVAVAHAGDSKITKEQFTAADADHDGALTLAEAQTGAPSIASKFTSADANGDGKLSMDELNAWYKNSSKSMDADQGTTTPPKDQ
jgi:Ca2+-binding EF-hand superfamily protein